MVKGTRLKHINGSNLNELEAIIEGLPYKVEVKGVNIKSNGVWYIHFTILDEVTYAVKNDPVVLKEMKKEPVKKRNKK